MPLIQQNFDEVPDSIPNIGSGIYNAEITKVTVEDNKALTAAKEKGQAPDEKCGRNIVVQMKILNEGKYKDLSATTYIPYFDAQGQKKASKFAEVQLKRLCLSAKVDISNGLNTDDLLGKIAKPVIEEGTYTPPGGVARPNSSIKSFLIPTDDGYNS